MRASRGEIKIEDILRFNGLSFIEEYSFDDLLSFNHKPLRFDFAVFDDNGDLDFLIEYQGIQHYEPFDYQREMLFNFIFDFVEIVTSLHINEINFIFIIHFVYFNDTIPK